MRTVGIIINRNELNYSTLIIQSIVNRILFGKFWIFGLENQTYLKLFLLI